MNTKEKIKYVYKNCPVPGGGFVTGFVFHPKKANILYARTDIGGVYRYDFDTGIWHSLMNHVTEDMLWEANPLSIALSENDENSLYIACGNFKNGLLCVSHDRGDSFEYFPIPTGIHGNAPGRGTGERLQVDKNGTIYFGSQIDGLMRSTNGGESWEFINVCEDGAHNEKDITFVWVHPDNPNMIVVSTSGQYNSPAPKVRGASLYISTDAGKNFSIMEGQPEPLIDERSKYSGYVGQRATFDGAYLYISMSASGERAFRDNWSCYACDCGDLFDGAVLRYEIRGNAAANVKNITPRIDGFIDEDCPERMVGGGIGGIAVFPDRKGALICTTQYTQNGEYIFYSDNYGDSWVPILHDLTIGKIDFTVPYMKPEYNGNSSLIHWMSDLKVDPFNSNRAVFNTGTGIFMTENLGDAPHGTVVWRPECKGVEETVHLNVYSPPAGDVKVIDIIGDLGGFAFTDLDKPCENTFADKDGNRYITCINGDFPDSNPYTVVATPRANWRGDTEGGIIISDDQCQSWTLLPQPYGLTPFIDGLIDVIRQPNNNSGWVAISADGGTIVWTVGQRLHIPITAVVHTRDRGESWHKSEIFDLDGKRIEDDEKALKVMADRVNPDIFYGFGDDATFFVSRDGGGTFHQRQRPEGFYIGHLCGIDGLNRSEIRVESGKEGVIWISMNEGGLWRVKYDKISDAFTGRRISKDGDKVKCQGMGKNAPGSEYKTLYINGTIDGEYGFWRSFDEGESWQRINDENQMYGSIRSIAGDPRTFGRFYLATGTRGILYGQPADEE